MNVKPPVQSLILFQFLILLLISCGHQENSSDTHEEYTTWSSYLGDPGRSHYSTLSKFTKENIGQLKIAWTYNAPDWGQMQMNPIVVDSILYGVTAALRIVALHAATGKELWQFGDSVQVWHSTSRGVSFWADGRDRRIFCTRGADLYALDALTGKPIASFGNNGKVDLRSGLSQRAKNNFVISNTPGAIFKDLIIMPLRLSESAGGPPGDVVAFNVRTGAVAWSFHTIPDEGHPGNETWGNKGIRHSPIVGAANNWSGMAVDGDLGIVYVPTGSAAPDFYGGNRLGSNLYANCLLALEGNSGRLLWYYQFTHHDIWDRDLPAPPNLLYVERNGKKIPAVAQVTKQGYVFVFNRITGEPLFDIAEVPVPKSKLKGEVAWPTQPLPLKPEPFARQSASLSASNVSPFATNKLDLKAVFEKADKRWYAPPGMDPVLLLPGYDGAAEWGGAATDPNEGILYVNANEMAWMLQMEIDSGLTENRPLGNAAYINYCATCHQNDRSGLAASGFPSLLDLQFTKNKEEVSSIIAKGKGMMPGFPQIPQNEKEALLQFLFNEEIQHNVAEKIDTVAIKVPYKHKGYTKFLDGNGLPGIDPPWGTLHAIDLNSGDYLWSIPFGDTPQLGPKGKNTGTENYGGPVVTKNGLLFIAATKDGFFRVFDKKTGALLWEYELPAPSFATPALYEVNGKQYIALACGGEKLGTKKGNQIVAFSLE